MAKSQIPPGWHKSKFYKSATIDSDYGDSCLYARKVGCQSCLDCPFPECLYFIHNNYERQVTAREYIKVVSDAPN